MSFGALQITDSLQALLIASGSVATFGEDRAWEAVNAAFIAHNRITADLLSSFVTVTSNRQERIGLADSTDMEEMAEYGSTDAQKIGTGPLIGLPLRRYGHGLAWNRDYLRRTKASEFAAQITNIFAADLRRIQRQIKRAIHLSTNYTWIDVLIDKASIPVKALANNDGMVPPVGPNGEIFLGTHQHYLGTASGVIGTWVATDLGTLITTVAEHAYGGELYVGINQAQEAAVRAFAGFVAYIDVRVTPATTGAFSATTPLNVITINNRPIGVFQGAEIWVKPWCLASYVTAWVNDPQQHKALGLRIMGDGPEGIGGGSSSILSSPGGNTVPGMGDLQLVYDNEDYPLRAREYVREFDVAVLNRTLMAVQYLSAVSYTVPTIP